MQVELYDWEVKEAIADYMKKEYGMDFNTDHIDQAEIEYLEVEKVYKKHKNGKIVKNAYGNPEVDWENSPTHSQLAQFGEGSKIILYVFNYGDKYYD